MFAVATISAACPHFEIGNPVFQACLITSNQCLLLLTVLDIPFLHVLFVVCRAFDRVFKWHRDYFIEV